RGVAFAGLENKAVARGNGYGAHPARHHAGEVKGGNAGHNTQRLAQGPVVHAGGNLVGEVAFKQLRNTAGKFDNVDSARNFALCIAEYLAMFRGNNGSDGVAVLVHEVKKPEHDASTSQRRGI